MNINNATFITSVAQKDKFISTEKPLIAIVGKSNVGKSSLINMLTNQKKLAKTSNTPGRTRLINYFDCGEFVLADLPGYGFAKVSKNEKLKWADLMESFLATQKLAHLFILVDVRHDPTQEDVMMIDYAYHYRLPFSIIATKCDKLGKSKIKPRMYDIATKLKLGREDITGTSFDGYGKSQVFALLEQVLKVYNEKVAVEK